MNRKKLKEDFDSLAVLKKLQTILTEEDLITKQKQFIYLQYKLYYDLYTKENLKNKKLEEENIKLLQKLSLNQKQSLNSFTEDKENVNNIELNVNLNGLEFDYAEKDIKHKLVDLNEALEEKERKIIELENKIIKLQIMRRCEQSGRVEIVEQSPDREELINLKAKLEYLRVEGDKTKRNLNYKLREYMVKYEESNLKYKQCYQQLGASLNNLEDLRKFYMSKEIKKTQKLTLVNSQIKYFSYGIKELKNKIFELDLDYSDLYKYTKFTESKCKELEDRVEKYKFFSEKHVTKEGDDFYEREISNLLEACDSLTEENKKLYKEIGNLKLEIDNVKRKELFLEKKLSLNELKEKSEPGDIKVHLEHIGELNKVVQETCKKLELSNTERNKLTKLNIERITTIEKYKEDLRNKTIENSSLQNQINETLLKLEEYYKNFEDRLRQPQLEGVVVICNLCDSNTKSVALVSCMHTFCSQCIETRIKLRNRRCPTCGTPFGTNDIRKVYI